MKLYIFPPSARALGIVALNNHLGLDCEIRPIDLGRGDQLTPEYIALNPNRKMPTLEDDGFVLWESSAILFYMAAKCPDRGLWPSDLQGQGCHPGGKPLQPKTQRWPLGSRKKAIGPCARKHMYTFKETLRRVLLLLALPLLTWPARSLTADAPANTGATPVPAMTVPLSGYLTPRAKEVIITHDAWDLNGFTSPSGDSNAQVESRDLQVSCAAHSKQIIEGRLNKQYPANIEHKTIGGVPADVVTPQSGIAERNRNRVLINMHGGGFIGKCPDGLVEALPIAGTGRIKVITVDYREAPEAKFPAASEDVTAVYRELLKSYAPENIGLYGCSAGGVLAGQATAWIITHQLPRPGAIGVFCAGLADWGGDSMYTARFLPSNPTTGIMHLMTYTKDIDTTDPTLYPAGNLDLLAKFPPVLFVTATRDMAMSVAIYSHNQLAKAGVESDLRIWDGLGHAFIIDDLPEAKDANDIIVKFFDKHLGSKALKSTPPDN